MADTILSGRWVVYYGAENRQKRITRDTSITPTVTDTVNALYSALQNQFDELTQMDDGVPMSAQTPTEYTIGIIDAGDKDPWFIDRTSVEYLSGGALKTASWDRVTGTNTGILKIVCNNTSIVAGDIGFDITIGGNTGTLLDVKGTGAGSILWVRPDDNTATNDFDDAGTLTCNAHTATWTSTASAGESLWANIYTLGTIESNTHLYISQNGANLTAYKDTTDWWGDGHIDILVNVKELGVETDEGYIGVFARQYSKTYSYYTVDLTNGGRNPIPLQTGNDLDNQTGYWTFTGSSGTGTFVVGEVISKSGTFKKGVITSVTGSPGTTPTIVYYLIGDPITNFANADTSVTGETSSATVTAGTPAAAGPSALGTSPVITHGGLSDGGTNDIDENGTPENYSVTVDCNQNSLANVYQYSKYITRRGETATTNTDGLQGQFYIGSDYRLRYSGSITGTFSEGNTCTQTTSGAKGTIVEVNTTDKIVILRNSRGTFDTTNIVTDDTASGTFTPNSEASAVTPIAAAPFGTFAGGKFFCAPGVVLSDYLTADANNFQLVDDNGTVRLAPTKATITVSNTRLGDKVAVFRLTASGGDINKAEYNATVQSQAATTVVLGVPITTDSPGKTVGGVIRLVDTSATREYRLRFSTWTNTPNGTFNLAYTNVASASAGTTTTNITSTGIGTASLVGDLVLNVTQTNAVSYVSVIVDANNVTISPAITGQTTADNIKFNALPVATTTSPQDTWYVPFIDSYETTGSTGTPGSEAVTITHSVTDGDIFIRVRARQAGNILPFEQDSSVVGANPTNVSVVRTTDTIFV
ncbi:MAG: hypothetical protein UR39_C0011G0030 [Candidatus Woesebacteria bacterium GW2011_GWA1_33_30]|uniref:Uncharacterized protein n=1 Tax=Candidatus Woesebacteria bacterium GW2011_GWA2_33_28 TaxID=1618561 RepID=A0A0F9ZQ16_9BACT|nr:MAG: hypothetical protein UR38_C0011G0028 [Candidatus Woesebacteria bacterium GW2011_GWA2_33_28]KKP47078.1 MAG: hypothetical protein UR39_C0011G0030 [Candidatus Woesebacteria bacterium GW2011_GWA1_33_30]KKP48692.1 MAG: hypothetical protein UR40_C0012G0028 [Microgenomates group bacterium GW2011_GWC1_33_32]KKP51401.1 MAG: hypothetical protein UR44_C0011G0028 [Candidatus Woesebacteria bacterium GW2011_GWB1_33_38]KKP57440.1 MAG: hypothetical protein UR48_C0017G0013 [Microgenomates group bacteriu